MIDKSRANLQTEGAMRKEEERMALRSVTALINGLTIPAAIMANVIVKQEPQPWLIFSVAIFVAFLGLALRGTEVRRRKKLNDYIMGLDIFCGIDGLSEKRENPDKEQAVWLPIIGFFCFSVIAATASGVWTQTAILAFGALATLVIYGRETR